jgi:hypothetical protein
MRPNPQTVTAVYNTEACKSDRSYRAIKMLPVGDRRAI